MMLPNSITAVVLAGGLGSRMGGLDKGLQRFAGVPLALHALLRLQQQSGDLIAECMLNANRNLAAYEAFGVPVWPDVLPDHPGPLAGFLTALGRCDTPWLLTVPCDTPRFPLDLAQRLAQAVGEDIDIAMASGPDGMPDPNGPSGDAICRPQPVFCLLRVDLLESLQAFIQTGGRKIDRWTAQHRTVCVPFDRVGDDPLAFANANTLAELTTLERCPPAP